MTKKKTAAAPPPPPQLALNPQAATPAMRSSLQELQSSLLCPLCNKVFDEPATLSCSHTFCLSCMDEFAANNWNCPVCGAPLACRGSRETSYLSINPQIQTVCASLKIICNTLNHAPPEWWNSNTDSQEEEVDMEQYSPEKSLENSQQDEDEYSPEDSEQTEAFSRPKQSPRDWMTPIIENRSCGLPSQSPGMSPISHMASQQEQQRPMTDVRMEGIREGETETSNGAQESPLSQQSEKESTAMNTKAASVPLVLLASELLTNDLEILEALQTTNTLKLITANQNTAATADYAVCGNAEITTGDGFLVGRTYPYLLAVARGIPIVNISYFQEECAQPVDEAHLKHQVIGDAESTKWMAPQRAIESKQEGIALLEGYTILLFGDFESLPKSPASKRSRSGSVKKTQESTHTTYSLERLQCLLQACGATIVHDIASLVGLPNHKVAVMLRPDPHPRDWRAARKELEEYPSLPLIRGNWLLDSISNFQAKNINEYTQAATKK